MRRALARAIAVLAFGGAVVSGGLSMAHAAGPHVALIELDDAIHASSERFLSRAIDKAAEEEAQLIIVRLNTPGGLLDSTRDMVDAILNAPIPVVVYVAPTGAHAASAGTFITAAAHVAAMAPVTNIGAASPVAIGEELPETLERKVMQDAAALLREIAEARGRNSEALEETVFQATAYSATEALEIDIIDIIAEDVDDLLSQLDGRTVVLADGTSVELDTSGLPVQKIDQTAVELFLSFIANPNIAFTLISLGFIAVFVEWVLPGLWGPGIIGVIALALGFVALGNLPVNWVGVALIAFSMLLFFFETQTPGVGIFGVSGVISFLIGGFLLMGGIGAPELPQAPSFRVSPYLVGGIALAMAGVLGFLVKDLAAARRAAESGAGTAQSLTGQLAVAVTALSPSGTVRLGGEDWTAVSDRGESIDEGEQVIVAETEGLTLKVFKADEVGD